MSIKYVGVVGTGQWTADVLVVRPLTAQLSDEFELPVLEYRQEWTWRIDDTASDELRVCLVEGHRFRRPDGCRRAIRQRCVNVS